MKSISSKNISCIITLKVLTLQHLGTFLTPEEHIRLAFLHQKDVMDNLIATNLMATNARALPNNQILLLLGNMSNLLCLLVVRA